MRIWFFNFQEPNHEIYLEQSVWLGGLLAPKKASFAHMRAHIYAHTETITIVSISQLLKEITLPLSLKPGFLASISHTLGQQYQTMNLIQANSYYCYTVSFIENKQNYSLLCVD